MANYVEKKVIEVVKDLLSEKELELVNVEYVKERDWYLRVFIDKNGGIEIDDCQQLSEQIENKLDEMDFIKDSYILEVSSPGLDRVLKNEKDFEHELGKMVDITTYAPVDGEKIIVGKLTGYDKDSITLNEDKKLLLEKIACIRLHIEF
ncbi:MAG: ribosome maturation factor RimP [Selenomonadaceae bacterium]